jgi:general secretion pathway protein B
MSYILDALKKAEQERKQGEIPTLQSIHGIRPGQPDPRKRGAIRFWLTGGALLVVTALGIWWGIAKSRVHNRALQEQIAALENNLGDLQRQSAPTMPSAFPTAPTPQTPATDSAEAISSATATGAAESVSQSASSPPLPPDPSEQPPNEEPHPAESVVSQEIPVAANEMIIQQPEPIASFPAPDLVVVPQQKEKTGRESRKEEAQFAALPLLQDLPNETQKRLPPLKVSGHVYAREPGKRMVLINSRICREGDLVDNDLYLEKIIWEGVVLRHQDIRFRINIL